MASPEGEIIVVCGFRADGLLRAMELTDDDELKIALATAAGSDLLTELEAKLETTDLELVSKILSIGSHGWFSSAWQRNPLLMGYSGHIDGQVSVVDAGENPTIAESAAVDPGELWVIQSFIGWHNEADSILFYVELWNGSTTRPVGRSPALATNVSLAATVPFVMAAGHKLCCRAWGVDTGKTVNIAWWGMRVDIDQ